MTKRSENCKKQWEDGKLFVRYGKDTSQWKGGVSKLQQRCRAALYTKWSRHIMIRGGFECQFCKSKGGSLCVHHDEERFAKILTKFVENKDVSSMDFEQQGILVEEIVHYHVDNNISGITLCTQCHRKVHEIDSDID